MGFLLLTALRDRIAGVSVAWKMSKTKGDMLAGNGTQKGQDENQLYGERRRSSPTPAQPSPAQAPAPLAVMKLTTPAALPLAFNFIAASK